MVRSKLRGYERAEPDTTAIPGKRKAAPGSSTPGGPEPIGALLTRRRLALGLSQLRLAEKLCDVSGMPTVSRHEVSRWEREDRLPGRFWLGWLAVVFGVPLERLEAAMAASRGHGGKHPAASPSYRSLWTPPTASELLAVLDMAPTHDLSELAHAWVTGPPDAVPGETSPAPTPAPDHGRDTDKSIERLSTRLHLLRRYDDLIGGCDLAPYVDRELRTAVELLRQARGAHHQRTVLALIAGYAQLAGWVHSDAGNNPAARRAYRAALRAAAASGDRLMGAHVLGSLSHHCLSVSEPYEALLLARTAYAGARVHGTPLLRTLLLHRVALAAAWVGEHREAWQALRLAARTAERAMPEDEPQLYWLDKAELAAMTGQCLAVLGRPARAVRLLAAAGKGTKARTEALYQAWLARAHQAIGEAEQAAEVARAAERLAGASGSARAVKAVKYAQIGRHRRR